MRWVVLSFLVASVSWAGTRPPVRRPLVEAERPGPASPVLRPFEFLDGIYGPEFLVLYLTYLLVVFVAVRAVWSGFRRARGNAFLAPEGSASFVLQKPVYQQLAYLRGGLRAVVEATLCELARRGIVQVAGDRVLGAKARASAGKLNRVELAVLSCCGKLRAVWTVGREAVAAVRAVFRPQLDGLRVAGLLPRASDWLGYAIAVVACLTLTAGLGLVRLARSLARGRTNVGFLVLLTVLAAVVSFVICYPRVSPLGHALLERLRTRYRGTIRELKAHRVRQSATEATYAAALFGAAALAGTLYADIASALKPPRKSGDGSCGGCGGGGCGGCGGGCGGCGG